METPMKTSGKFGEIWHGSGALSWLVVCTWEPINGCHSMVRVPFPLGFSVLCIAPFE
ncbi:hypothetical protein COLO4_35831 [Corchorus olitorius]|uniref:Uncharacterized protein n=1 Tax=Corchorus olitorius TaxID=93759 RepID=A0A1R3GD02_9ROSI|nr:hypothetical protein COLO4_35831 [Corchorus olitorius]